MPNGNGKIARQVRTLHIRVDGLPQPYGNEWGALCPLGSGAVDRHEPPTASSTEPVDLKGDQSHRRLRHNVWAMTTPAHLVLEVTGAPAYRPTGGFRTGYGGRVGFTGGFRRSSSMTTSIAFSS